MDDRFNEPIDRDLGLDASADLKYLPPDVNYYLHFAAKWAIPAAAVIGVYGLLTFVSEIVAQVNFYLEYEREGTLYPMVQKAFFSILQLTAAWFLLQFGRKTKRGIECDDEKDINAGIRNLGKWAIFSLIATLMGISMSWLEAIMRLFFSQKGSIAVVLLVGMVGILAFNHFSEMNEPPTVAHSEDRPPAQD